MASDLEVLTLTPTDSHSGANRPSACWGTSDSVRENHKQNHKGQLWRSPTPTENVLDFVPRIRTQLSLCLYKDQMAHTNGPSTPYSRSTPQGTQGLFQVHKAHVDCALWTPSLLSSTLEYTFSGRLSSVIPPIVGSHPPVPLFENGDHHPSLPCHRYCPQPPRDIE